MKELELPSSVEAEATILGAILLDNEAFYDDSMDVQSEDFSLDSHRRIYTVVNDILFGLVDGVNHVDIVTLSEELKNRKWIQSIGGVSYLAGLTEGLPRKPVIEEYVRIIKEKSRLRRLMTILDSGLDRANAQRELSADIITELQDKLGDEEADGVNHSVEIGSCIAAVEERVNKLRVVSEEKKSLELTWGIDGLDDFTRGAFSGEFTVVSGESGGMKTGFGVQMILANAREGIPCAWFSLEMSKEKIAQRYYPAMSDILTASHLRDPRLMNLHSHIPEMKRVSSELAHLPIRIDDTNPLRIDKLKARVRMMVRKYGTRLFIVDYVQLVEGMPGLNETQQFKKTIMMLRDLPKNEPSIHLVVLSQYSKADGFMRNKGRTKSSNYGGSVIEHAAQNMLMISVEDADKKDLKDSLEVEIKVAKQREGRTGKVSCFLDRDHLRFYHPQPAVF